MFPAQVRVFSFFLFLNFRSEVRCLETESDVCSDSQLVFRTSRVSHVLVRFSFGVVSNLRTFGEDGVFPESHYFFNL